MPTVFFRERSEIFHKDKDCVQLTKKPGRGVDHPVMSSDLNDLKRVRPCYTCYPDAPHVKVVRRFCSYCNATRVRACPHNGGIPITIAFKTNYVGLLRDPGEEGTKTIYVWPDQLYRFETV